jgi:hypothetical protein
MHHGAIGAEALGPPWCSPCVARSGGHRLISLSPPQRLIGSPVSIHHGAIGAEALGPPWCSPCVACSCGHHDSLISLLAPPCLGDCQHQSCLLLCSRSHQSACTTVPWGLPAHVSPAAVVTVSSVCLYHSALGTASTCLGCCCGHCLISLLAPPCLRQSLMSNLWCCTCLP